MKKEIDIKCSQCAAIREVKIEVLAKYFNRRAKIPCLNCGNTTEVNVNADLFNQKPGIPLSQNPNSFETKIISHRVNHENADLMRVKVEANDYCKSQFITLKIGKNTIGRMSSTSQGICTIDTRDKRMSRSHCTIDVLDNDNGFEYILTDFSSANGTFLKGKRLEVHEELYVKKDDIITIGETKLKLIL